MAKTFQRRVPRVTAVQFDGMATSLQDIESTVGQSIAPLKDGDGMWWISLNGYPVKLRVGDWVFQVSDDVHWQVLTDDLFQRRYVEVSS